MNEGLKDWLGCLGVAGVLFISLTLFAIIFPADDEKPEEVSTMLCNKMKTITAKYKINNEEEVKYVPPNECIYERVKKGETIINYNYLKNRNEWNGLFYIFHSSQTVYFMHSGMNPRSQSIDVIAE